jgi:cell division septation protein DedD
MRRGSISRNNRRLFAMLALSALVCGPLAAAPNDAPAVSQAARAAISAAFDLNDPDEIVSSLSLAASRQKSPADRKALYAALAAFEERTGRLAQASAHYGDASSADPAARDYGLVLDAARAALAANETDEANGLVRAVLVSCFDDAVLLRARVYFAWIQLASGDTAASIAQIRGFAANPAFGGYIPALLFTLWWSDSDESAKKTLLDGYPTSPEAAVARGDNGLSPVPFWFLMPRKESSVAAFAKTGSAGLAARTPTENKAPVASKTVVEAPSVDSPVATGQVWQQVGFFRNREYADELVGKLKKAGFAPVVRTERRASGTVYYSVVVQEDADRTSGARLKDAGFESCLVFD